MTVAKVWNGTAWEFLAPAGGGGTGGGSGVTLDTEQTITGRKLIEQLRLNQSATAPASPAVGQIWVDSTVSSSATGEGFKRLFLFGGSN